MSGFKSEPVGWQVLALKADRIYVAALRHAVERACPGAVVRTACSLAEARVALTEQPVDLLLAGFGFADGDVLSLIGAQSSERGWRQALIVTARKEDHVLSLLRAVQIAGVFDPDEEDFARLVAVLPEVLAGRAYWSPSVLARLRQLREEGGALCRRLTPVELLVFSAVGDGSDDAAAAARLEMKLSYVSSVRELLHEKLGVQHKGDLMRLASEFGVVRLVAGQVQRPGFARLLASRGDKRPRVESAIFDCGKLRSDAAG